MKSLAENIVYLINNQPMTDSRKLAEAFGVPHNGVLRKIGKILESTSESFRERNFALTSRSVPGPNGGSRPEKVWGLTRDGFMHVALTFTGAHGNKFRELVIEEFNSMEATLLQTGQKQQAFDPLEVLELAAAEIRRERARADNAEAEVNSSKLHAVEFAVSNSYKAFEVMQLYPDCLEHVRACSQRNEREGKEQWTLASKPMQSMVTFWLKNDCGFNNQMKWETGKGNMSLFNKQQVDELMASLNISKKESAL